MRLALEEARQSLDNNEFPVGCVLVNEENIVAKGRRQNTLQANRNELDHAEIVALRNLVTSHPDIDPSNITAYCTMEPCLMCYAALLLSNVKCIVYAYEDAMGGGTKLPLSRLTPLYRQRQIEIVPNILRQESLQLFKEFFQNPDHNYWQDSYLAEYTLNQK
ncbi:MAG: nucleoside deaminase [Desulfobulbaceae bacterium]|nr:nucleoside deaminase [Desulfobulbaceae bacterium]